MAFPMHTRDAWWHVVPTCPRREALAEYIRSLFHYTHHACICLPYLRISKLSSLSRALADMIFYVNWAYLRDGFQVPLKFVSWIEYQNYDLDRFRQSWLMYCSYNILYICLTILSKSTSTKGKNEGKKKKEEIGRDSPHVICSNSIVHAALRFAVCKW